WSSDVCSSDLGRTSQPAQGAVQPSHAEGDRPAGASGGSSEGPQEHRAGQDGAERKDQIGRRALSEQNKVVRTRTGKVVSDKVDKTGPVITERYAKDRMYGRLLRRSARLRRRDE